MVTRSRAFVHKAWLPQRPPGFVLLGWLVAVLLGGCGGKPAEKPAGPPAPVTGITTAFEDEVADGPGGQIAWSTYWKFCWQPYPGARSYELQLITPEGASPKLKSRHEPCYRIQVATGTNPREQGLLRRDEQIGWQTGQLAYRVRAVLGDNQYSEWSPVVRMNPGK